MNRNTSQKETSNSAEGWSVFPATHYFAKLMPPTEVDFATRQQPIEVREKTKGNWVLSGDVATPMFNLLKRAKVTDVAVRLTGFTSSDGFSYCVITHQIERSQHRFLLSLTDPAVRRLVESISTDGKLTFLLGNDDGEDALILENPLKPTGFRPVLAMAKLADYEVQKNAMKELPAIQDMMGLPLQVPSIFQHYAVRNVSVSMLMPSIINDWFNSALHKASSK